MLETYKLIEAAPTLASLAVMEVILSLDRLIEVNEAASHLPEPNRHAAQNVGSLLADLCRLAGLVVAVPLIAQFVWAQILGALYLLYIMSTHFAAKRIHGVHHRTRSWSRTRCILEIGLFDLALSVGSIVAALTLTRDVEIIWLSVIVWMIVLRLLKAPLLALVRRFPLLTANAPILSGGIGVLLLIQIVLAGRGLPTPSQEIKLLGLLAIVALSAAYDLLPGLQTLLGRPLAIVGKPLMRLLHDSLSLVFFPLHAVLRGLVPK
ncbi:MAG: hypothetical protein RLZZ142_1332 [Verrucomicrobiota bacterium]